MFMCCFLMITRPPRSTRTDTRFPYTTLFRSPAKHRLLGFHRLRRHAQLLDPAVAARFIPKPGTCGHRAVELLRSEGRERHRFSELVRHRRRPACGCAMEQPVDTTRSEERSVGKECVSTCSSRC